MGKGEAQAAETTGDEVDAVGLQAGAAGGQRLWLVMLDPAATMTIGGENAGIHLIRFTQQMCQQALLLPGRGQRPININGATTTTTPAPGSTTSTASGGLLALSSNIARTSENDFAVLPEFGANLTFELNDSLQLRAGYTILALNNVARTGNQIDRNINTNLIPGGSGAGPAVPSHTRHELSDFWAQGLNFGIAGEF